MATIDIRANVTCSLGDLISGSISDDYIQNNGLVKTKGSVELKGVLTPAVGTAVTFRYDRGSTSTKVPRKLRVLSSFADPFRQVTKVELGCKLTYFQNVTPAPTVDGKAAETSGRQQQCLNGYAEYPANSPVTIPVSAAGVMQTCLTKLGITASRSPLTNRFNVEKFDLSAGYVQVLADLLYSEGYFGYLDKDEVLQVRSLTAEAGNGPVIDASSLIDLDAIGVGELPGEAVVVRYNALKLSGDIDTTDQLAGQQRNWEEEEVVGTPQQVEVRYTTSTGTSAAQSFSYVPYSRTVTTYGQDESWDDTTCVIASSSGEGADLSNSVIRRVTTQRTILAESANNYCAQLFSAGFAVAGNMEGTITRNEAYKYDGKGQLIEQISEVYEPFFKWAGGIGVEFVYDANGTSVHVTLGTGNVLVERTVVEYTNIYAPQPAVVRLKPGETLEPAVEAQKVTTTTYQNWALTAGGQQGSASIKELAPFTTAAALAAWLNSTSGVLVMVDCQVRTQRGRGGVAGQVRPPKALRLGQANGTTVETTAQLAYSMGSASSERFVSFSMPYQSDDIHTATGAIVKGDAGAKALRFGRIQNRLLLGNRNGVSVQVPPNKLPASPFDPLYLSNGALMVQYRANATNWAFSSNGIVCSVDALYWGVAGGTGTSWVPVAPGITTFPPLPAVVDNSPANVIGNVANVGSTPQAQLDAAFPAAVAGDGVQDQATGDYWVTDGSSWSNKGPSPGPAANVPSLVPPWNEQVPMEGITRTGLVFQDYAYPLVLGTTDLGALVTRTTMLIGARLVAEPASYVVTGQPAAFSRGHGMQAAAGTFVLSGFAAGSKGSYSIGANVGSFTLNGQVALLKRGKISLSAAVGTFALTGQTAAFSTAVTMKAQAAVFTVTGQPAGQRQTRVLSAAAGVFNMTGQQANIGLADPSFSSVSLLMHMDGTSGSTVFTDSSSNHFAVTPGGNAQITTTQSKFGGASAAFDGTGDYLSVPDAAAFAFGAGAFTIEAWVRFSATAGAFTIASQFATTTTNYSWSYSWTNTNNGPTFTYSTTGTTRTAATRTFIVTANTWYHFAVTRSANSLYFFADGALLGTVAMTAGATLFDSTAPVLIGAGSSTTPASFMNGYIDDLRITKGVARYTAAFIPPTKAFSDL